MEWYMMISFKKELYTINLEQKLINRLGNSRNAINFMSGAAAGHGKQ